MLKIGILASMIIAFMSGAVWGVKALDGRGGYSKHAYHQTKPAKQVIKEVLPQIIHNPPLQIKSTEDFFINAQIKKLGNGIPIIYYRFDGDTRYYKRAMRKSPSGQFQFKILGAALTGSQIDYYIEVATGSRLLASLGDESVPISVAIISPESKTAILYFVFFAGIAGLVIKIVSLSNRKKRTELVQKNKRVMKTSESASLKRKAQLSVRSR